MVWALIGAIAGMVLGLTGAGGAMVSVPLFIHLQGLTIREATVFSLFVVWIGAISNFVFQRQNVQYKTGLILFVFATVGSFFSAKIKGVMPDDALKIAFVSICLFSLWNTWFKKPGKRNEGRFRYLQLPFFGILIGFIITLTGLGGGLVLIPFFISVLGLNPREAVATSLFTIILNSTSSFLVQYEAASVYLDWLTVGPLAIGCVVASQGMKALILRLHVDHVEKYRKIVFTSLVTFSMISVFFD